MSSFLILRVSYNHVWCTVYRSCSQTNLKQNKQVFNELHKNKLSFIILSAYHSVLGKSPLQGKWRGTCFSYMKVPRLDPYKHVWQVPKKICTCIKGHTRQNTVTQSQGVWLTFSSIVRNPIWMTHGHGSSSFYIVYVKVLGRNQTF